MSVPDPRAITKLDEEIGARMRARRQEIGVPLAHVAELVGVTLQQLQKYEAGKNRVAAATLMRIAKALQTDAAELLPNAPRTRRPGKSGADDGMALQLQHAFGRIKSKRERRMVLSLARRLAADAAEPRKRN